MRWLSLTLTVLILRMTMSSEVDLKASDNSLSSWETNAVMNVILNPAGSELLLRTRIYEILKMWRHFYTKFIKVGEFKKRKVYNRIKKLPKPKGEVKPPIAMNFDSSLPQIKASQKNLKKKIEKLPDLDMDISKIYNRKYSSWFPNRKPGTKITYYVKKNKFNIEDLPAAKGNAAPPVPMDFSNSIMYSREKQKKMKKSVLNKHTRSKNEVKETNNRNLMSGPQYTKSAPSKIKPVNSVVKSLSSKYTIRSSNTQIRRSKTKILLKNGRLFETKGTSQRIKATVKKPDEPKTSRYIMKYRKRVAKKRAKRRKKRQRKAKRLEEKEAEKENKDA